ncbi:MAG: SNF2-related protein [Burkholderiaceae bacterium]|nr:SNF2-related protein [Burkholderiaceae bacterium]
MESLASTLVDAQADLDPHQVEAALFACQSPLAKGLILADGVGLGKTIEAGQPVICSYPCARGKAQHIRRVPLDLVVLDEAHRLRNVYKPSNNVIGRALMAALEHVPSKVLLIATPLQNSLLELYGLVSLIFDRVFGNLDSFRSQFGQLGKPQTSESLHARLSPTRKRTLRRDAQPVVQFTQRRPLVQEFTPSDDERRLAAEVGDYLRRPQLEALPTGQRQLVSMVLWKRLASSSHAIAGAPDTIANRLQKLPATADGPTDLAEKLNEDFEALDESADEWSEEPEALADKNAAAATRQAMAVESAELRQFVDMARRIRDNAKDKALLQGLDRASAELARLNVPLKAIIFAAVNDTGDVLTVQDAEKLLRLPAGEGPAGPFVEAPAALTADVDERKHALLRTARERQLRFFELEVQELHGWADALKYGLEQRIKDVDRKVKDVRHCGTVAAALDEKLSWQKRELEAERSRLRRELFDRRDEVDRQRDRQRSVVIGQLECRLAQRVDERPLFTIEWELA